MNFVFVIYCFERGDLLVKNKWIKNGEWFGNKNILVISYVIFEDVGIYECIVKNYVGIVKVIFLICVYVIGKLKLLFCVSVVKYVGNSYLLCRSERKRF